MGAKMKNRIQGTRICGIAGAVPASEVTCLETAAAIGVSEKDARKIAKMTGVLRRRIAPQGMCTSDLAYHAATRLLDELGWERASVQALVVVTQTPDHDLPATACTLQSRLGLSSDCAAFDLSMGCSGYVYGLWVCANLAASGGAGRILLLAGDTISWICSPKDRSTSFLFGDAATATALERDPHAPPMDFVLGTDGSGKDALIVPGGAYRHRSSPASFERRPDADGRILGPLDLHMDGAEVFKFTLDRVPGLMQELLSASGWSLDSIDAFVPHQANLFMLRTLSELIKIAPEKLIISLDEYGNTSSASIPLALSHRLAERLRDNPTRCVLSGFGVGLSWAAAAVTCGPMVMPSIVSVEEAAHRPLP